MSSALPERASLEFLTKQAKDFLRDAKAGDAIALDRLRAGGPEVASDPPKLADCQHALAREYGFASWPKLKAHVESLATTDPVESLAAAMKSGELTAVREVLARFPSLKSRLDGPMAGGSFGATALITAVQRADRELVDLLLAGGADINQRSHWWAGGFHVLEDDHGLADFLIARGATLDAKSAAQLGRLEDLRTIVTADPSAVHQRGGDGQTPLHVAPTVAVADFLLDRGAEIDARDVDHESTPAQYLVRSHTDVAKFLVARGAKTDILMSAALGDLARVRGFLEADPASIRTLVSDQYFPRRNPHSGGCIYIWTLGQAKTAHAVAREFGHDAVYELLMQHTPDTLKLAVACELGDEATLAALLEARPDLPRTLGAEELRMLPIAAQQGNVQAVRRMLTAGWPPDTTAQHGATALHWAGFHGNAEVAREILKFRPALEAKEKDFGMTALGWTIYGSLHGWHAQSGDYAGVLELLLDAGARAPKLEPKLEASEAVLSVLRRREFGDRV
ncbi:MAG: ankyrin repeat domain-containing protein [Candidatus Eisenbacteria bacterium]|uniref:Ankyrin repeat domain-containing protein n=1 Tax=Eiseniibacteriota bacterium TaxID=2212470 RepID=A0A849SN34_UNCEI|nr:ankyrin repeat domain-containing protein [Candidatus Eisenbacteria bacterium]